MSSAFLVAVLSTSVIASDGGSVIGNGGDPIFHFLESTRVAMVETLLDRFTNTEKLPKICENLSGYNTEQIDFCKEFIQSTWLQMVGLNRGKDKTPFVLRNDPLFVLGPDGEPMPVAARTVSGPGGVIEFHRSSIRYYRPSQALFLIAHEFGHKVEFGGIYLGDNEPVGPFALGRDLLDMVAASISKVALTTGKIGAYFGLRDYYRCELKFPSGHISGLTTSSPRYFYSNEYDHYEAGLSRRPDDSEVFVYESASVKLTFQIKIEQRQGCSDEFSTELRVIRTFLNGDRKDELVKVKQLEFNPICQDKPEWMKLAAAGIELSCLYLGTQGNTNDSRLSP